LYSRKKLKLRAMNTTGLFLKLMIPERAINPMEVADGPQVIDKNKIKSVTEGVWENLIEEDSSFDFNWLINILVEY